MRWFRKNGGAPRLLSLSPLRGEGLHDTSAASPILRPPSSPEPSSGTSSRRSRIDMLPARWPQSKRACSSGTNCYNVSERCTPVGPSSGRRNNYQAAELTHRERRNPLLDKVRSTKLTCFKSALPQNHVTTRSLDVKRTKSCDDDEMSCALNKNRIKSVENDYDKRNCGVSEVQIKNCDTNYEYEQSVNLSKSTDSVFESEDIKIGEINELKNDAKIRKHKNNFCFSAKLKMMSDRYLKNSTSKLLAKLYKQSNNDSSCKSDPAYQKSAKSVRGNAKLRSFSYGTLPGLDEFQKNNSLFNETGTNLEDVDMLLNNNNDDSDSGILVNDSANSSILDNHSRCESSASNNTFVINPVLAPSRNVELVQRHHDVYENQSRALTYANRCQSLDRREILKRIPRGEYFEHELKPKRETFPCDIWGSSPPLPPLKSPTKVTSEFKLVRLVKTDYSDELGIFITKSISSDGPNVGYVVAHVVPGGIACRDGTLKVGDEIINVSGRRLRGLSMSEAREALCTSAQSVDLVICRHTMPSVTQNTVLKVRPKLPETDVDIDSKKATRQPTSTCNFEESSVRENVVLSPISKTRFQKHTNVNSKLLRRSVLNCTSSRNEGVALSSNLTQNGDDIELQYRNLQNFVKVTASNNKDVDKSARFQGNDTKTENITPKSTKTNDRMYESAITATNFCTLPRRPRSAVCTFHTIVFEKGPGKKSLGFTIVGGRDSPKGALGIFIKSILETGQASDDGRLRAGDEVLAVNGNVCHDLSHLEAVTMFKGIKSGPVALHVCRRAKCKADRT